MSASKVYFTDMRCPVGTGLLDKLKKLIEKAGIDSIDMDNKFVAIKIHFGEPGNLSFLRPNFAKVVADKVTSLGGRPFLTDCNTLYVGRRKHALEHLAAAQENGFSPLSTGCQMTSSPTASRAPTRWKCPWKAATTSRAPSSAAPSWMPTSSSA